jgi:hypothetical protein
MALGRLTLNDPRLGQRLGFRARTDPARKGLRGRVPDRLEEIAALHGVWISR